MNRRAKIIATLGPASATPARVDALLEAGMDAARLNCAHEKRSSLRARVRTIRRLARKHGRAVAVLADLAGPKMRTGLVFGGAVELVPGKTLIVTSEEIEGTAEMVSTTYRQLAHDVRPGDSILIDDGLLSLRVVRVLGDDVETEVAVGGILRSRKGLNLPGVPLSGPSFTDKDRADLEAAVRAGVDYVAVSFVRRREDLEEVRAALEELERPDLALIAKLERPEALEDLTGILRASEGVMVARGDLGVETSAERVPVIQKRVIREANRRGRIAITATQMLDSMINNRMPTRAEASDVANAILDGSDAVMLSGETAVGSYPVETVETMARIIAFTERNAEFPDHAPMETLLDTSRVEHAVAAAARQAAVTIEASHLVAFTDSGATVRQISRLRPPCGIFGFTPSPTVYQRLALRWGVRPMRWRRFRTTDRMLSASLETLKAEGLVREGERVVMVCGTLQLGGATNMMKIEVA